jgi:DNA-binding NarL/FixJ family response regulator
MNEEMSQIVDEYQDLSGLRVCIVSPNPELKVEVSRSLIALGLDVETFETLQESERARMAHVVVINLHAIDGTVLDDLRAHFHSARIIAVSAADEEQISKVYAHGLHGYLVEGEPVKAIASAIIAVARGTITLSLAVWTVIARHVDHREHAGIGRAVKAGLTPRQIEVIMLAAQGRTDREIAEALTVSTRTVNRHIADTLRKLGVKRRRDAIRIVLGEQPMPAQAGV